MKVSGTDDLSSERAKVKVYVLNSFVENQRCHVNGDSLRPAPCSFLSINRGRTERKRGFLTSLSLLINKHKTDPGNDVFMDRFNRSVVEKCNCYNNRLCASSLDCKCVWSEESHLTVWVLICLCLDTSCACVRVCVSE